MAHGTDTSNGCPVAHWDTAFDDSGEEDEDLGGFGVPGPVPVQSFDSDALSTLPGGAGLPEGHHRMPDGQVMADSAHLVGQGYLIA